MGVNGMGTVLSQFDSFFQSGKDFTMQSNIEEHRLTDTKHTFVERIAFSAFGAISRAVFAVTDSRTFMIVMHGICFSVVALCLLMAFRTGKYGTYLVSAGTITGLSFLIYIKFKTTLAKNLPKNKIPPSLKNQQNLPGWLMPNKHIYMIISLTF